MKNSGDNISSENANWKFSGKMVKDFEKHVSKSVPIYERGQKLIVQLSDYFIKKDSIVYDIGCSTGKLLFSLIKHNTNKGKVKFIGIDVEKDMIDFAKSQQRNNKISNKKLELINQDVVNYDFEKNDFLISFFTIQFIHPKHRQDLINKIEKITKQGCRVYSSVDEIPKTIGGLGTTILSTSKGVMSDSDAREKKVGGEVLISVF